MQTAHPHSVRPASNSQQAYRLPLAHTTWPALTAFFGAQGIQDLRTQKPLPSQATFLTSSMAPTNITCRNHNVSTASHRRGAVLATAILASNSPCTSLLAKSAVAASKPWQTAVAAPQWPPYSPFPAVIPARSHSSETRGLGVVAFSAARSTFSWRELLNKAMDGVFLFVVLGVAASMALLAWAWGTPMHRVNPYTFHVQMAVAPGVHRGTPARMKGVVVGSVTGVRQYLDRVDLDVEINSQSTLVTKGSVIELTQTGMSPQSYIDITPRMDTPLSREGLASPRDLTACRLQGRLTCAGDIVPGLRGGSMDEMMARTLATLRDKDPPAAAPASAVTSATAESAGAGAEGGEGAGDVPAGAAQPPEDVKAAGSAGGGGGAESTP